MTKLTKQLKKQEDQIDNGNFFVDSVKILSEITRKDIEKSYSLDTMQGTEAYFSNRYGWTLRRTID